MTALTHTPSGGPPVLVVGEVLVDLVWRRGGGDVAVRAGGSPVNVALGLHRLGRPVHAVTCWGDDVPGEVIEDYLARTGLPVERAPSASGRSTVALAQVDEETGGARYDFLAAWDPLELAVPADTVMLHTGSLAIAVEPGASRVREAARTVRGQGGTVAVDLNVRPSVLPDRDAYRTAVGQAAAVADVVKASEEDLAWLWPDRSPRRSARALLALGPRLAVVTLGAEGSYGVTADAEAHATAPRVDVTDTIGAGDAFQSALLDGLLDTGHRVSLPQGQDALARLLYRASTAGALACTASGAQPPYRDALVAATSKGPRT
ncbi:PfkB family carbohydrate kinase [Streptomyces sp. NPDC020403]|uniref:PfkB family carbohydrate kinase n=1 Tax=unclassified Streptomyces TaxID=2593676 RepID=UPI0033E20CBC